MNFLLLILCILTSSLYFCSHYILSVSSPSVTFLTGRRSLREQRMVPQLDRCNEHHQEQVLDDNKKRVIFEEHFREQKHESRNDLELLYHIDYNGVTTHPVPTPKHPRP
ncbi:uncharacterized protein LOC126669578 [Mercurialis annua]|uniref:uncharacterized protein LOC126669578 n=1 Tax=Mercurialis annua TaxID=3986 RepID=UPI0021605A7F|nr:uncharacterized protein LOC126669578 [Mercurialis annua]